MEWAGNSLWKRGLPVKSRWCVSAECIEATWEPNAVRLEGGIFTEEEWVKFILGVLDGDFDLSTLRAEWEAQQCARE